MIRKLLQFAFCVILCPLLIAEQGQPSAASVANQATKAAPANGGVPKNTVIELDALEPVSTATIGSNIPLAVVNDVRIKGITAIRAGTPVTGIITDLKRGSHSMTWDGTTTIRAWELEASQPIKLRLEHIDAHENQLAARDAVDPKKLLVSGSAIGFVLLILLKAEVK